jgi:hypothetical protein
MCGATSSEVGVIMYSFVAQCAWPGGTRTQPKFFLNAVRAHAPRAHSIREDRWADKSQQGGEWGRPVVLPQRDVGAALAALSEEDLLRLRAITRLRARSLPDGMVVRPAAGGGAARADGRGPWPPGVPLLAFLAGVMRSLCDEQWRRHRRRDHLPALHDSGAAGDPERACAAAEGSPLSNGCSRPTRQL